MKLLKFELFGMQKVCQRKSQLKVQPADQYRNYHKTISRMHSDKADISSAIVIQMLYSTCIWETGTVEVFGLICNIISSVSIE